MIPKDYQLLKLGVDDVEKLRLISIETFLETFADQNTLQNMELYTEENLSISQLTKELNHQYSEFYGVFYFQRLIAYLKINTNSSQTEAFEKALEIERIYILKEFQGQKIGQALMEKSLYKAKTLQCDFIWLGVWEHNLKAISFYQKNGFIPFSTHSFILGTDTQTDILMKRPLTS